MSLSLSVCLCVCVCVCVCVWQEQMSIYTYLDFLFLDCFGNTHAFIVMPVKQFELN